MAETAMKRARQLAGAAIGSWILRAGSPAGTFLRFFDGADSRAPHGVAEEETGGSRTNGWHCKKRPEGGTPGTTETA